MKHSRLFLLLSLALIFADTQAGDSPVISLLKDNNATPQQVIDQIHKIVKDNFDVTCTSTNLTAALREYLTTGLGTYSTPYNFEAEFQKTSSSVRESVEKFAQKYNLFNIGAQLDVNEAVRNLSDIFEPIAKYNKVRIQNSIANGGKIDTYTFTNVIDKYFKEEIDKLRASNEQSAGFPEHMHKFNQFIKQLNRTADNYKIDFDNIFLSDYVQDLTSFKNSAFHAIRAAHSSLPQDTQYNAVQFHNFATKLFALYSTLVETKSYIINEEVDPTTLRMLIQLTGVKLYNLQDGSYTLEVFKWYFKAPKSMTSGENTKVAFMHNMFYALYTPNILAISESEVDQYVAAYMGLASKQEVFQKHMNAFIDFIKYFYPLETLDLENKNAESEKLLRDFMAFIVRRVIDFLASDYNPKADAFLALDQFLDAHIEGQHASFHNVLKVLNAIYGCQDEEINWPTVKFAIANDAFYDQEVSKLTAGELYETLGYVWDHEENADKYSSVEEMMKSSEIARISFCGNFKIEKVTLEDKDIVSNLAQNVFEVEHHNEHLVRANSHRSIDSNAEPAELENKIIHVVEGDLTEERRNFIVKPKLVKRIKNNEKPTDVDYVAYVELIPGESPCMEKIKQSIIDSIKNRQI